MTDEQILEMIGMEKAAIQIASEARERNELIVAGCFEEIKMAILGVELSAW